MQSLFLLVNYVFHSEIVSVGRATPRGLSSSDGRRRRTTKGMQKECNFHFMSRRRALVHDGHLIINYTEYNQGKNNI